MCVSKFQCIMLKVIRLTAWKSWLTTFVKYLSRETKTMPMKIIIE